jgi:allantoate deiminase
MPPHDSRVETLMRRLDELAAITEEPGGITRSYGTAAMRAVNDLVGGWMSEAGMGVQRDVVGNLIGHYPATAPDGKVLLLGSHLDSVRDAGRFDGPLGVLAAISCVEKLNAQRIRMPFAIRVFGFCDEEGLRFKSTYLGSRAATGTLTPDDLKRADSRGVTLAQAIRDFGGNPDALADAKMDASRLLGYVEMHIEQGPVLEQKDLPAAVVSAIAGQTRGEVIFRGHAGHAGTTPMNLRHDALCGAAEFILAVEDLAQSRGGLVATVGEMRVLPGASNVIPGETRLTLDVRHPADATRLGALNDIREIGQKIGRERDLHFDLRIVHEMAAVTCDQRLSALLNRCVQKHQREPLMLHSGAGHDAAALAAITPVTMLFIRCRNGLSHHPDEYASPGDISVGLRILDDFVQALADGGVATPS